MPGPQTRQVGDLHVNTPLGIVSVAYIQGQDSFIADRVFPNIPVSKQSDIFWRYPKGTFFRTDVEARAPGAQPPRTSWRPIKDSYLADVFEIAQDITDEERNNADSEFQLDETATIQLTQQHLIFREQKWASTYFKTGVWARDRAGVASGPTGLQFLRFDVAGSDPITLIQTEIVLMMESTGLRPNTLIITPYVELILVNHATVIDRLKYTGVATALGVTQANAGTKPFRMMLAELFGIERLLVAETVVNSSNEVLDEAPTGMGFAFGKSMLLLHCAKSPGRKTPTAGYTFSWTGQTGASNMGIRIIKEREGVRRADVIIAEQAFEFKLIASDLGTFFSAVVA